ncbi:DUF4159 domain-containing protein [Stappia sp. ES.058]|uniref:DUF4159 domain-containing protein n=1 Tax=Stappia sp. ES.058 TaxID=1881061 RepID=UPI00087DDF7A|nr:DUF4159 domain-containing protein [Stappia sp. ES.058]SDU29988.1 N-terminal double-transmembrane domain-containing protein [Stappia sp. ES.058]
MISFLPLGFTAPLALAALLLLPAIWWLLRLIPPRPRQVAFPPARLLADIDKREETPDKSPLWLTLLRLALAAALIIALAGPIWRPLADAPAGDGPLWLVVDNGWASAADWETQRGMAERILETAAEQARPVLLAATAEGPDQPLVPQSARVALDRLRALEPRSWPTARGELTLGLRKAGAAQAPGAVIWLSTDSAGATDPRFVEDLGAIAGSAALTIYAGLPRPTVLAAAQNDIDALTANLVRPAGTNAPASVRALDRKGLVIGESQATFDEDGTTGSVRFDLPVELRNDIARLEVSGEASAAGVQLLDDRSQRRTVGLVSGASVDQAQPLLSPLYYLDRALSPFTELRRPRADNLDEAVPVLIDEGVSVLIMADVGRLRDPVRDEVARWVDQGGVLVRFAGPRLAGGTDDLIPTPLRAGDRALGGSLSWDDPQPLADFAAQSPFAGLEVPNDVTVNRQVLAEPGPELSEHSWALLADGTPLVTASERGRGRIILFHVSADTAWSNLPLSGTFVEMLRRIVSLSGTGSPTQDAGTGATQTTRSSGEPASVLPPVRVLNGFGRLGPPPASAVPMDPARETAASRRHPPGLYGHDDALRAVNLFSSTDEVRALDIEALRDTAEITGYPTATAHDLRPVFFVLALLLLFADALALIWLRGDRRLLRGRLATSAGAALLALGLAALPGERAVAQETSADLMALEASLDTRLAYVVTGDARRDETSRQGLYGLTRFLASRTALEPEAPVGVDIASDELAFFPLLYWPISEDTARPSPEALARIDTYMRNGGTILFDTADQLSSGISGLGTSSSVLRLRAVLDGLDIPPLEPVPADHVLTKAFYLLDTFPGRYAGGPLWVEASERDTGGISGRPVRAGDGVSPVLITGNDFAAAWAIDEGGTYLYPTVPPDQAQRDYAFRSGVNIVMYALTGNYKADQVHIPALLERLGQ